MTFVKTMSKVVLVLDVDFTPVLDLGVCLTRPALLMILFIHNR